MTEKRRHGKELENAIFDATIDILNDDGLDGVTFSKVAARVKTSRPVIYRRWDSPFSLALEAIRNKIRQENHGHMQDITLSGQNLSEDLSQVLQRYMVVMNTFSRYYVSLLLAGTNSDDTSVLDDVFEHGNQENIKTMTVILNRAIARDEIKEDKFSNETKLLPFEWLRYHLFTESKVSDAQLKTFIKCVLIPVYTQK